MKLCTSKHEFGCGVFPDLKEILIFLRWMNGNVEKMHKLGLSRYLIQYVNNRLYFSKNDFDQENIFHY